MSMQIEWGHQSVTPKDVESVSHALNAGMPRALEEQLEQSLARICTAPHAITLASPGVAYQILFQALNLTAADQLITTPFAPIAPVRAALSRGARLTLIDSWSPEHLQLTPRTRGRHILLVSHYAGQPVATDQIEQHLRSPHDMIIEDASDALGASYKDGSRVGSCRSSHFTLIDLHARSITAGSGALLLTWDHLLLRSLHQLRSELDARINPLGAALAISQQEKLERFLKRRRHVVEWYRDRLSYPHIHFPDMDVAHSACSFLPLQMEWGPLGISQGQLQQALAEQGIQTRVTIPLHRQLNLDIELPQSDLFAQRLLELPIYPALTENKVEEICQCILKQLRIS